MTGKADYTEEEWKLLREAPTSAGMLVIQADRGGRDPRDLLDGEGVHRRGGGAQCEPAPG